MLNLKKSRVQILKKKQNGFLKIFISLKVPIYQLTSYGSLILKFSEFIRTLNLLFRGKFFPDSPEIPNFFPKSSRFFPEKASFCLPNSHPKSLVWVPKIALPYLSLRVRFLGSYGGLDRQTDIQTKVFLNQGFKYNFQKPK